MFDRRSFIGIAAAAAATGCSTTPEWQQPYTGPEVTQLDIRKSDRVMYLWSHGQVIRTVQIDLGFRPTGRKRFEGDGKTPEGSYFIDRRNPESHFYLSLGISYPNRHDVTYARAHGRAPGGDIFIHGQSLARRWRGAVQSPDWTAGCIAVSNTDMTDLYRMVRVGTPITISA